MQSAVSSYSATSIIAGAEEADPARLPQRRLLSARRKKRLRREDRTMKTYSIEQALRAQRALRDAAGLGPETFPIEAFVGMISDEIETLRSQGKTDAEIAALIEGNSAIEITAEEIAENFASAEARHPGH